MGYKKSFLSEHLNWKIADIKNALRATGEPHIERELNKKPELIIHIGNFKTGTSSLQRFLSNSKNLLEVNNMHYIETSRDSSKGTFAHHNLAYEYMDKGSQTIHGVFDQDQGDWNKCIKEIYSCRKDGNISIISSEAFMKLDTDSIEKLRDRLEGISTRITIYLRRHDEYINSYINQILKFGRTFRINDIANEFGGMINLRYLSIVQKWIKAFGVANVDVIPYDGIINQQEDYWDTTTDFVRRYIIADKKTQNKLENQKKIVNKSASIEQIIIAKMICQENSNIKSTSMKDIYRISELCRDRRDLNAFNVLDQEDIEQIYETIVKEDVESIKRELMINDKSPWFKDPCNYKRSKSKQNYNQSVDERINIDAIKEIWEILGMHKSKPASANK